MMSTAVNDENTLRPIVEYKLEADSELRIELELKDELVTIQMINGYAEIFGAELFKNKVYTLYPGTKVAVFTWHGCLLKIGGKPNGCYVSKETPMVMYLNCHAALEQLRRKTDAAATTRGPIVMVVGPTDVGKSTLCRTLLNYAIRSERKPIFIDLDVGQNSITIPGNIGAVFVESVITVEDLYSEESPIILHYGHTTPSDNLGLYNALISKLQIYIRKALEANKKASNCGVIINTCGWIKSDGYRSIIHAAKTFEVDAIIVLDQERLYNELVRDVPDFVKISFLPKSCGVVEQNQKLRAELRDSAVQNYFYGHQKMFHPHCFDVKFAEVNILRYASPSVPGFCMPVGMNAEDSEVVKVIAVELKSENILHHILAISYASTLQDELIGINVMGFVLVTSVDDSKETFTVLSPLPGPLPNNILIVSDVKFVDNH